MGPARLPRPSSSAGILKDLARFLPACVTVSRRLRKDPRVPLGAKVAVVVAGLWVLSPIDLIPEFLPVIGLLDDHGAERFAHLRSYLSTSRKHDIPAIDALVRLFNGDPWIPPAAPAI